VTVPHRASQRPHESWVATYQPCCTTALEFQCIRLGKATQRKHVGPSCGFAASPGVGLGATVSTLRIRYPRVQALSQDNGSRLLAGGSSGVATCPHGSGSRLRAALGLPRAPMALALASRLRAAPGMLRVTWAPAPTFWLRAAPTLLCVPRTGSASCKQLNKYPLTTQPS
jgi:hypothetical protein